MSMRRLTFVKTNAKKSSEERKETVEWCIKEKYNCEVKEMYQDSKDRDYIIYGVIYDDSSVPCDVVN